MNKPRVLIINKYFGLGGGAEIIATSILGELQKLGIPSELVVAEKRKESRLVTVKPHSKLDSLIQKITGKDWTLASIKQRLTGIQDVFFAWPGNITSQERYSELEVINMHNVQGNYFGLFSLMTLSRKYKVIWTLHDAWITNSTSSYASNAKSTKLKEKYPDADTDKLDEFAQLPHDAAPINRSIKRFILRNSKLTIVTPSQWLNDVVSSENILSDDSKIITINNGIDTKRFAGLERSKARKSLGIPEKSKVIYCQAGWVEDHKKGIIPLLEKLPAGDYKDYFFVITGYNAVVADRLLPQESGRLIKEYIDNKDIAEYYAAADVYAMPSLFENYSTTLLESHAVGTPSVAFDIGGNSEIIIDGETGMLVEPYNFGTFWEDVFNILDDNKLAAKMSKSARDLAQRQFDIEQCVEKYIRLFELK